jgi:Transcriptional activator TraM
MRALTELRWCNQPARLSNMNQRVENFRQKLQKELRLTVGPKDPILAEVLAQQELLEELAGEHQRMLMAFEEALAKNQAAWADSAKNLANQSLAAALGAARDHIRALSEEAARSQTGAMRAAAERGVERLELAAGKLARLNWVTFAASVMALLAAILISARLF